MASKDECKNALQSMSDNLYVFINQYGNYIDNIGFIEPNPFDRILDGIIELREVCDTIGK